jgi:hypothetical protein
MLICNYSYINKTCGHYHSGITNPVWIIRPHTMRGYFGKSQVDSNIEQIKRDSFPTATNPPYSIVMGDKGALLSSSNTINNTGSLTANLVQGINISSTLSGNSDLIANASLLIQLISNITTSTTLSGTITGLVQLASALSGDTSVTSGLGLIAFMSSTLSTSSTLTADLKGKLWLEADLTPFTDLSPENLAASVWNSLAASFNNAGTMGEIMNNMGAVSDPWSVTLPGGYTADQAGAIVDRLEDLAKKIKALTAAQL